MYVRGRSGVMEEEKDDYRHCKRRSLLYWVTTSPVLGRGHCHYPHGSGRLRGEIYSTYVAGNEGSSSSRQRLPASIKSLLFIAHARCSNGSNNARCSNAQFMLTGRRSLRSFMSTPGIVAQKNVEDAG